MACTPCFRIVEVVRGNVLIGYASFFNRPEERMALEADTP